jgi:hypothetical protein
MNATKDELGSKARTLPKLRFESQKLTSFSGLVVVQALFEHIGLRQRLQRVFRTPERGGYRSWRVFLLLIVHVMLGFRRLRESESYRHDPLVKNVIGVKQLPDVSTISRRLASVTDASVRRAHAENRALVLEGLSPAGLSRFTLDFDGSVCGTRRHAEGTAVGFNRKRKGQRSYYPLLCTVAQSAQAFDFLHRPGNVHDSNGAEAFMNDCLGAFRQAFPYASLELRTDSAFFNEDLVLVQDDWDTEFSMSVPFERFADLKERIESRQRWYRADGDTEYFEMEWKPDCWARRRVQLIAVRRRQGKQRKGPLQLDLFEPMDFEHQYTVIATNKTGHPAQVIAFHHGRGSQEGVIGELKSAMQFDYIPCRKRLANETYMLATVFAHNLLRRLQMQQDPARSNRGWKRPACWVFEKAHSLQLRVLHRAGKLTTPGNQLTLTISGDRETEKSFSSLLEQLRPAA